MCGGFSPPNTMLYSANIQDYSIVYPYGKPVNDEDRHSEMCVRSALSDENTGPSQTQGPTEVGDPSTMMASSNGNIFHVTGPLWGQVTRSFDVFFDIRQNKRLSKQSRRRWFDTPSRSLWRHCNVRHSVLIKGGFRGRRSGQFVHQELLR